MFIRWQSSRTFWSNWWCNFIASRRMTESFVYNSKREKKKKKKKKIPCEDNEWLFLYFFKNNFLCFHIIFYIIFFKNIFLIYFQKKITIKKFKKLLLVSRKNWRGLCSFVSCFLIEFFHGRLVKCWELGIDFANNYEGFLQASWKFKGPEKRVWTWRVVVRNVKEFEIYNTPSSPQQHVAQFLVNPRTAAFLLFIKLL